MTERRCVNIVSKCILLEIFKILQNACEQLRLEFEDNNPDIYSQGTSSQ